MALPLAALLPRAWPNSVAATLAQPEARQAIALSARTAVVSTSLIVLLGTPLVYVLARRFPGPARARQS